MEDITFFKGANWASLSGAFTPEKLREVAQEIEDRFADFKEEQNDKE